MIEKDIQTYIELGEIYRIECSDYNDKKIKEMLNDGWVYLGMTVTRHPQTNKGFRDIAELILGKRK